MSIINDALKKIQNNRNNLNEKDGPILPEPVSSGPKTWQPPITPLPQNSAAHPAKKDSSRRPAGKRWLIIVFLEILAFCLAVWILFVMQPKLFSFLTKQPQPAPISKNLPTQPIPPKPQTVAPPVAITPVAVKMSPNSKLVLNGVMRNEDKMVALINGEIYEVGHYVNGKEISSITLEGVELRDGDKITVLNVR